MSQAYVALPYRLEERKRPCATLSLICDDESLSDAQLKAYQTRLQEYRTFLDAVSRLALCGNVCVTEEAVTIGEHGLLTGESLNALQHAGAISVYNTLQQNNWEFPISEEGEVAIVKAHVPIPDEFLDSEKPIRSDWPAVHISECFVEGERAKLHGSVRPLRTFLPPTIVFRNAADVEEDVPEPEVNIVNSGPEGSIEIVQSSNGLSVKKPVKDGKGVEYIPIYKYYFGRQTGNPEYVEEKNDFRFKCAVCQRIFYSNTKLMSHIVGHVDEESQACLDTADTTQCTVCNQSFPCAFDLREHIEKEHIIPNSDPNSTGNESQMTATTGQATSQVLVTTQRGGDNPDDPSNSSGNVDSNSNGNLILAQNLNGITNTLSCRICAKPTVNEILLAHHLQSTHRQCEMPYVCRLCLFRSSMYEDILDHFKKVHDNSNHLLCPYCLRIFTPSDSRTNVQSMSASGGVNSIALGLGIGQTQVYLQHLRMHQIKHQLRRCPTCRLNFTNKSDYQVHRRLDHKATRGPGIEKQDLRQSSYEQSYRMSVNNDNTIGQGMERDGDSNNNNNNTNNNNTFSIGSVRVIRQQVTSMNAPEAGCAKSLAVNFYPEEIDKLECLECGKCMSDAEHAQYLPCSVCRFATCCRVGFQRHYEKVHIYSNPSQSQDIDSGMPMIRQVYFDWSTTTATTTNTTTTTAVAESNENLQYNHHHHDEEGNSTAVTTEQTPSIVISNGQEMLVINEITDLTPNNTNNDNNNNDINMSDLPTDITNNEINATGATTTPMLIEQNRNDSIINYMENQIDSRLFYCSHCGANQLDGNSLARHLVEECGTLTATLNPDPYLLIAQQQKLEEAAAAKQAHEEAQEHERLQEEQQEQQQIQQQQQQQQQQELAQNENNMVFDATNQNVVVINDPSLLSAAGGGGAAAVTDGDVIMVTVDGDQLSSMQLVQPTDDNQTGLLTGAPIMTQMTTNGTTTIDVTDAGGEVVQQFVLPDDLQLEEGQTLVMIQDENGQPQLAIVNQADLINANGSEILMQTDDDQANNILIYANGLEGQAQLPESVQLVRGGEEEKENQQQFIVQ